MKKTIIAFFAVLVCFSASVSAQIPTGTLVQIVKAEDERRFDKTLENLINSPNADVRARAALAAGRIGNDAAILALANLLENDKDLNTRTMAAFALGEIESIKGADAILSVLKDEKLPAAVKARAVEAAGKIAAANPKEEKSKELGQAILDALDAQNRLAKRQDRDIVLQALTAVLRVNPETGNVSAAKFLLNPDADVRATAANTMARLRAKNANETLRAMLTSDVDAVARANAARALSAAGDQESAVVLLDRALADTDARVRVSAVRALGNLKYAAAAEKLLARGNALLANFKAGKNEILEIVTALGRILPVSNDEKALGFFRKVRETDRYISPETEIAYARVAPKMYVDLMIESRGKLSGLDWRAVSAFFQGLGEIAGLEATPQNDSIKSQTRVFLVRIIGDWLGSDQKMKATVNDRLAVPDLVRAFAAFKSENTSGIFRPMLETEQDIFIRAALAEILGDQKPEKANVEALVKAFDYAFLNDVTYNDAQLAILDALAKLDKKAAIPTFFIALNARNYLLRKKALEFFLDQDLQKDSEFSRIAVVEALAKKKDQLSTYSYGSKLGQITNTEADYKRAVSRKNGRTKAVLTTEKGIFTIDLLPEDAPLTVDNFIKLARSGYFNGLSVHRVVPNFVMQDGDPRGDGNGGPGWEIRCELNLLSYERGMVGMALSGKDTGGSQWFVTHSPQPHLDGGYTIFGRVNETDMKIVDTIARGDKILSVKIIEGKTPQKSTKGKK